ncbi:SMP-30/gluconolactonase/LRE family protein [Marivirga arenosa]|uniref:SMP-30/gluconolactonase/LRE family protein n=1 Tax=Marivirga arenosa TaxID=3059076 RepID=A0AA51ZW93_9BACT|nr:SMP-30/gluconolactonase/LRE family protein [Marivirga sp. BKB1-2]WNB17943.1 SMP-30/gluconolactonase/LRE family protein [Marivirga sp. BKB1-2]
MIDFNKSLILILIILLFSACQKGADLPISDSAELIKISNQFDFTEGPTSDAKGNVYFTDQPKNKIYKYNTEGKLSVFTNQSGRSNGLYIDSNQNLWACADGKNQLWKFKLDGSKEVILNDSGTVAYNGPNDVWIHENGNLYFTDPIYQRPYWENAHDTVGYQSFYLFKNKKVVLLDSSLVQANGIIGSSKNNLLFVADIGAGKTYRYEMNADGSVKNKLLFANQGSDGMTLDSKGNLYLTGKGVDIYNRKGEHIQHLDINEDWTANVCFGGMNNDELFITASKSLYKIQTNMEGVK